jgi:arsenate reductase
VGGLLVYHNPRCSKSRGALALLAERGVDVEVVEYLRTPPDQATLAWILDTVGGAPSALVRVDDRFQELGLDPDGFEDREAVIALLLEHPELLQRPVVIRGERGLIARPPERVVELLDDRERG